jgi:AcrR family transcriptional regulator
MVEAVKPTRRYHSPRRQEQAAITRTTVLDAAQRLFECDGYPATSVQSIATEAGVVSKTVYLAFTTKSGLLRAVWDRALRGDEDDEGVAQREWYREVMKERDPARQLRLNARNARIVKMRIAPLLEVIRNGAPVDPDVAALSELIQRDFYENQRAIVELIHKRKGLRRGLDVTTAADILWTLNHPDVWLLLVERRGWSSEHWEQWFADTACAQLLREPGPAQIRRPGP